MHATQRRVVGPLVVGLFLAYLLIQLLVPVVRLGADTAVRFGWQMFSAPAPAPEFVVVTADGTRQPIELDDFLAFPRADLPLESALPPHLCRVLPETVEVLVGDQVIPCR